MLRAINTAGLSDLEKRVVKATYDDGDPPKLKHVEALLLMSADTELVPYIDRRLINPQWNVAFKALILSHRLMQEGNPRFMEEIAEYPSLFVLDSTIHQSSGDYEASTYAPFIEKYAIYLTRKIAAYRALNVSVERQTINQSKKWANKLSNAQLIDFIPALQSQFTCIMKCSNNQANHPILIAAMSCLVKDAFRLYSILTLLMMMILERYETFSLPQTERMLQSTHKFILQNRKFRKWASALAKSGFVQKTVLPNFDAIPDSFLQLLEEHIESLGGVVDHPTLDQPPVVEPPRRNKASPRGQSRRDEDDVPTPRRSNAQANNPPRRARDDDYDVEEEKSARPLRRAPSNNQSNVQSNPPPTRRVVSTTVTQSTNPSAASAYRERARPAREQYDEDVHDDYDEPPRRAAQSNNRTTNQPKQNRVEYDDEPPVRRGRAMDNEDQYDEPIRQPRNQSTNQPVTQPRQPRQPVIPIDLAMDDPVDDHHYDEPPARAPRRSPNQSRPSNNLYSDQPIVQPSRNARAAPRMMDDEDELDFLRSGPSAPVDDAADVLAMFAPPTPMGPQANKQSNNQSINQPSQPAARRPAQPMTARSRDQARAAIADSLNHDLNLFEDFDPTTLHPAEQEALDREQQAINAAFFGKPNSQVNIPPPSQPSRGSSIPPTPPPRYVPSEPNFDDLPPQKPSQKQPRAPAPSATALFDDDELLDEKPAPRSSRPAPSREPQYDDEPAFEKPPSRQTKPPPPAPREPVYVDDDMYAKPVRASKPPPPAQPVYDDEDDYVPPPPRQPRPPQPRPPQPRSSGRSEQPQPVQYDDDDEQQFVDPFADLNAAVDPHTMQPVLRNSSRVASSRAPAQSSNNLPSNSQARPTERVRRTKAEAAISGPPQRRRPPIDDDEDFT